MTAVMTKCLPPQPPYLKNIYILYWPKSTQKPLLFFLDMETGYSVDNCHLYASFHAVKTRVYT